MKQIKIINGPNLNLLGKREPEIYGSKSFCDYLDELRKKYQDTEIKYFHSNTEGNIVDELQISYRDETEGIVLNAGAYTHYSIAIRDAIKALEIPVVEVHISNIFKREEFRHHSVISDVCVGIISGFGLFSYDLAIEYLLKKY